MSKKLFKKLCLALSIALACSFVPSMMLCSAHNYSIISPLGTIEVKATGKDFWGCFPISCAQFTAKNADFVANALNPNTKFSMQILDRQNTNNVLEKTDLIGTGKLNFPKNQFSYNPLFCIKNNMLEETKYNFTGQVEISSTDEPISITCTADATSSAASLIAPIGAIVATILGFLAL